MRGAIPPLPNTQSWRGSQLKYHRDNFKFTFTFTSEQHLYFSTICCTKRGL